MLKFCSGMAVSCYLVCMWSSTNGQQVGTNQTYQIRPTHDVASLAANLLDIRMLPMCAALHQLKVFYNTTWLSMLVSICQKTSVVLPQSGFCEPSLIRAPQNCTQPPTRPATAATQWPLHALHAALGQACKCPLLAKWSASVGPSQQQKRYFAQKMQMHQTPPRHRRFWTTFQQHMALDKS